MYKISAVWGAHEGSLLLWAFFLSGWSAAIAFFSRNMPLPVVARVLSVMGMITHRLSAFHVADFEPLRPDLSRTLRRG